MIDSLGANIVEMTGSGAGRLYSPAPESALFQVNRGEPLELEFRVEDRAECFSIHLKLSEALRSGYTYEVQVHSRHNDRAVHQKMLFHNGAGRMEMTGTSTADFSVSEHETEISLLSSWPDFAAFP